MNFKKPHIQLACHRWLTKNSQGIQSPSLRKPAIRPLLYAVYYFAGIGVGVHGLERGLLASEKVGAALEFVARVGDRFAVALDGAYRADVDLRGLRAVVAAKRRRRECWLGWRQRSLFHGCDLPALCRGGTAALSFVARLIGEDPQSLLPTSREKVAR
jgi:hypothetical protein